MAATDHLVSGHKVNISLDHGLPVQETRLFRKAGMRLRALMTAWFGEPKVHAAAVRLRCQIFPLTSRAKNVSENRLGQQSSVAAGPITI